MKMTTIELRKLTAAKGKTLTNGEAFGKEIYLGVNDSPDNWWEIAEEDAIALQNVAEEEQW